MSQEWISVRAVEGGAQGDCDIVCMESEPDVQYFRKTMKPSEDSERRRRFFTEATLFRSVRIDGVPRIVDTNADYHEDKTVSLYYVAQHIEGTRLDHYSKGARLEEDLVVHLLRQLLTILRELAERDIVHRDIKPENIIVAEGDKLFLVDFGIAAAATPSGATRIGQELGNRFLRLPELSAGSTSKRDTRTDLTLAVAIALYCMTRVYPRVLVDESGAFPHQRGDAPGIIASLNYMAHWNLIFDQAFRIALPERWDSSSQIVRVLDAMTCSDANDVLGNLELLKSQASTIDKEALSLRFRALENVRSRIESSVSTTIAKATGFRAEREGWVLQMGDSTTRAQIRAYPIRNQGSREHICIDVLADIVGAQIVGRLVIGDTETEVCRGDLHDSARLDLRMGDVERSVIEAMASLLTSP